MSKAEPARRLTAQPRPNPYRRSRRGCAEFPILRQAKLVDDLGQKRRRLKEINLADQRAGVLRRRPIARRRSGRLRLDWLHDHIEGGAIVRRELRKHCAGYRNRQHDRPQDEPFATIKEARQSPDIEVLADGVSTNCSLVRAGAYWIEGHRGFVPGAATIQAGRGKDRPSKALLRLPVSNFTTSPAPGPHDPCYGGSSVTSELDR